MSSRVILYLINKIRAPSPCTWDEIKVRNSSLIVTCLHIACILFKHGWTMNLRKCLMATNFWRQGGGMVSNFASLKLLKIIGSKFKAMVILSWKQEHQKMVIVSQKQGHRETVIWATSLHYSRLNYSAQDSLKDKMSILSKKMLYVLNSQTQNQYCRIIPTPTNGPTLYS